MQHATLTVMGLYNYDNTIFDNMVFPASMDKQLQINHILMECAELELLYNRPDIVKAKIGIWSQMHLLNWQKLWETTQFEYNPIENYDRKEDFNEDILSKENNDTTENEKSQYGKEASEKGNVSRETSYTDDETRQEKSTGKNDSIFSETDTGSTTTSNNQTVDTTMNVDNSSTSTNTGSTTNEETGSEKTESNGSKTSTETVSAFNSEGWNNKDKIEESHNETVNVTSKKDGESTSSNKITGSETGETTGNEKTVSNGTGSSSMKKDSTTNNTSENNTTGTTSLDHKGNDVENRTITGTENSLTDRGLERNDKREGEQNKHNYGRAHGNIGVTTTQDMITQERELWLWNIYEEITGQFKEEFCVLIY